MFEGKVILRSKPSILHRVFSSPGSEYHSLGLSFCNGTAIKFLTLWTTASALFLDIASTQYPSVLTLFTLDITLLSPAGLVSIEKVLNRFKLEYLNVNLTGLIAQVLNCASWSALKALVVSGDNINEWLQLWPSIVTPRLVSLEFRGTGTGAHKLSHSNILRIHQWIYASPLIEVHFANIKLQDNRGWVFLVESMDPSCLKRLLLGDASDDRFKACGDTKDRYNSKFQTG